MTDADFDKLVADHRDGWIADAGSLCRSLDWHSVSDERTIHVLDAIALPPKASEAAIAWTLAGSDEVLRPLLTDRRRGPVLVLDVRGIVRERLTPETLNADEAYVLGRLEVAQVAIHELGHATLAATRNSTLPAGVTIALLAAAAGLPKSDDHQRKSHGRDWCRSYLHLSHRAANRLWPRGWWLDAAKHDLRLHGHGNADEIVAALKPELGSDEPLADILRRDPPAAFTALFRDEVPPT